MDLLREATTTQAHLQGGLGGGVKHLMANLGFVGDVGDQNPLVTQVVGRVQAVEDVARLSGLQVRGNVGEVVFPASRGRNAHNVDQFGLFR